MLAVQLCYRICFVVDQVALRTRTAATALRTLLSSVALGSLSTPKSLIRIFLATFLASWVALLVRQKSLILSASFAQSDSFSSLPSLCFSSFCFAASSPASACNMSFPSAASDLASSAASACSFSHEHVMMVQLHNEAYSLPEALLAHSLKATIFKQKLEALPAQLDAQQFQSFVPKLNKTSLRFWMILHQEALDEFKLSNFDKLPNQRPASRNANLGNWQASSSFAKQLSFYAWMTNRHHKLASQAAFMMSFDLEPASFAASVAEMELGASISLDYRGADTQLVWWGKLSPSASQPSLQQLGVTVGAFIYKIPSFDSLDSLFSSSCFDWGGASSSWQLSRNWKLDSEIHPEVYRKLVEELGAASPLAKLIQAQLDNPAASKEKAAASASSESPALTAFWKKTAKLMSKSLHQTLDNVEALLHDREAEAFFAEAWDEEEELVPPASEEPAGRFDGSDNAIASRHSFTPWESSFGFEASACRGPWQLQAVASEEAWQKKSFQGSFAVKKPALQRSARAACLAAWEAASQQQSLQLHSQFWVCSFAKQLSALQLCKSSSQCAACSFGSLAVYSFEAAFCSLMRYSLALCHLGEEACSFRSRLLSFAASSAVSFEL